MWRHLSVYNDFVRLLINFELLTSNNFPIRLKLVLWKHCFKSRTPARLQHGCHLRQKPQKLSDTNGEGLRFAVSVGDGLGRRQWTNVEGWTGGRRGYQFMGGLAFMSLFVTEKLIFSDFWMIRCWKPMLKHVNASRGGNAGRGLRNYRHNVANCAIIKKTFSCMINPDPKASNLKQHRRNNFLRK